MQLFEETKNSAEEQPKTRVIGIYDDSFIDEYRRLTNKVHTQGVCPAISVGSVSRTVAS